MSAEENRQLQNNTNATYRKLAVYKSFDDMIKHESELAAPVDYRELFTMDSRKFEYVEKIYGKISLVGLITTALVKTTKFMSFEISGDMVGKAAELIAEKFSDCKIADLKMFETYLLSGGAGKLFRLDTPTLVQVFSDYYAQREDVFAEMRESRHNATKREMNQAELPTDERMREIYISMNKKAKIEKEQEKREQAIKFKTAEEICAMDGIDYKELLEGHKEHWYETWSKSSIQDVLSFDAYCVYRKGILDGNIKQGKKF